MQVRRIVSVVGRRRTFPRQLPAAVGGASILASTEGGLKYLKRDLLAAEPVLVAFVQEYVRPGMVAWDIGANLGLFTFMAAGLSGPDGEVISVEADTWLVDVIRRAARRNPRAAPVRVIGAAVSNSVGIAQFEIAENARAANHLTGDGSTEARGTRELQLVPTVTLDSMLDHFPAPQVVKIDVERAEARVLEGAERLLKSHRPVVLIEVGAEASRQVAALFADEQYVLHDARTGERVEGPAYDTLAIPQEVMGGRT